jgi:hypothetical protein
MMLFRSFLLAAFAGFIAGPAAAQQFSAGDITVELPWSRATPKGADVAVGYMVVHNKGAAPDKLLGAAADFAEKAEVHQMTAADGVMKMRELAGGLEIPPKGAVSLKPNGYHLMFHGLKRQLVNGQTVKAVLNFEHAGAVAVEFKVEGFGAKSLGGSMDGMKMN